MKTKAANRSRARILRREDSLKSLQYRGVCVRVLYECEGMQIVRTEMEPGSILDDADITHLNGVHFVIGGSPVFHVAKQSSDLMPGDSIALQDGQRCTVSNPTSARASVLSFLFKSVGACYSAGALIRGIANPARTEKELSR